MKPKKKYVLIFLLLALTAALAVLHLTTREAVPENALRVTCGGKAVYLNAEELNEEEVRGILVNGKGKESSVEARGLSLSKVLEKAHVDVNTVASVIVTARDEFSAEVSGEEIRRTGRAYLISDETGITLVVFGDANAKRNVRQVERIDVQ